MREMDSIKELMGQMKQACQYLSRVKGLHLAEEIPKLQAFISEFEEHPAIENAEALLKHILNFSAWHEFDTRFNTNILNTHITVNEKAPTLKSLIRDLDAEIIKLHQTA